MPISIPKSTKNFIKITYNFVFQTMTNKDEGNIRNSSSKLRIPGQSSREVQFKKKKNKINNK